MATAFLDKHMECTECMAPSTHNGSVSGGLAHQQAERREADQEPTVILDRHILREQFRGNHAEPYLLERQKCTEYVIKNYPD